MSAPRGADAATLRYYGEAAPTYAASGPGGVSRHLHGFLDRLTPGARILELGCGGGRDCAEMLRLGFDVVPTDGVAAIARQAEHLTGRPVRVMRHDELDEVAAFDAVYANASLLHVPRSDLPDILSKVRRALRPGGLHFASYKAGGTEGRDCVGRYFNYLSLEQMRDSYTRAGGWSVITTDAWTGGGWETGSGPWVAITARRDG